MAKQRKLIDLDDKVVEALSIQAIKSGHKNIKRYIEHVLRIQAAENKPLTIKLQVDENERR